MTDAKIATKIINNTIAMITLYFTGAILKTAGVNVLSGVVLVLAALVAVNLGRLIIKEIRS